MDRIKLPTLYGFLLASIIPVGALAQLPASAARPAAAVANGSWIPFQATSIGTAGKTGLLVIPSNAAASAPTPIFLNDRAANHVLAVGKLTQNYATAAQTVSLGAILYTSVGPDGDLHVYGANLSSTAEPPVEKQISNLKVAAAGAVCLVGAAQLDLRDPTTLLAVLDVANTSGCFNGRTDKFLVVHYSDSATTTPALAPATASGESMTALYGAGGTLGGVLYLDSSANELRFYAKAEFSDPVVIGSGVSGYSVPLAPPSALSTLVAVSGSDPLPSLYAITPTGSATKRFDLPAWGDFVQDGVNIYTMSATPIGNKTTQYILEQQSLTGDGSSVPLFTGDCMSFFGDDFNEDCGYGDILFSGGKSVFFSGWSYLEARSEAYTTNVIYSVPVNEKNSLPTAIATESLTDDLGDLFSLSIASPTRSSTNALMFINQYVKELSSHSQSAQVFTSAGSVKQTEADARYLYAGPATYNFYGSIAPYYQWSSPDTLEVAGISTAQNVYNDGGAHFEAVNTTTLGKREMNGLDGKPYLVPTAYSVSASAIFDGSLASGSFNNLFGQPTFGAVFDLTRGVVIPVTIENTNVISLLY
jgi:hypothetical protein